MTVMPWQEGAYEQSRCEQRWDCVLDMLICLAGLQVEKRRKSEKSRVKVPEHSRVEGIFCTLASPALTWFHYS